MSDSSPSSTAPSPAELLARLVREHLADNQSDDTIAELQLSEETAPPAAAPNSPTALQREIAMLLGNTSDLVDQQTPETAPDPSATTTDAPSSEIADLVAAATALTTQLDEVSALAASAPLPESNSSEIATAESITPIEAAPTQEQLPLAETPANAIITETAPAPLPLATETPTAPNTPPTAADIDALLSQDAQALVEAATTDPSPTPSLASPAPAPSTNESSPAPAGAIEEPTPAISAAESIAAITAATTPPIPPNDAIEGDIFEGPAAAAPVEEPAMPLWKSVWRVFQDLVHLLLQGFDIPFAKLPTQAKPIMGMSGILLLAGGIALFAAAKYHH